MEHGWYQDAFARGTTVIVDNDPSQVATVRYADYNDPRKAPVAYELKWGEEHLRVSAHRVSLPYEDDGEDFEQCECWRCRLLMWVIDVEYATHDTLKLGGPLHSREHSNAIDGTHRVVVLADSYTQAIAMACEMVSATHPDAIPTATMVVL